MSEHQHDWVLVRSYDSLATKPKPVVVDSYIGALYRYRFGGYHDIRQEMVDLITRMDEPSYTSETWACNCGETKTNTHKHAGLSDLLADVPNPNQKENTQ